MDLVKKFVWGKGSIFESYNEAADYAHKIGCFVPVIWSMGQWREIQISRLISKLDDAR